MIIASLNAGHERCTLPNLHGLLENADSVKFLRAVCVRCKADASFTHRHTAGATLVGGAEQYEAICGKCLHVLEKKN